MKNYLLGVMSAIILGPIVREVMIKSAQLMRDSAEAAKAAKVE